MKRSQLRGCHITIAEQNFDETMQISPSLIGILVEFFSDYVLFHIENQFTAEMSTHFYPPVNDNKQVSGPRHWNTE